MDSAGRGALPLEHTCPGTPRFCARLRICWAVRCLDWASASLAITTVFVRCVSGVFGLQLSWSTAAVAVYGTRLCTYCPCSTENLRMMDERAPGRLSIKSCLSSHDFKHACASAATVTAPTLGSPRREAPEILPQCLVA